MSDKFDESTFDAIAKSFASGGVQNALDELDMLFTSRCQFHELFEVLKMKVRHSLGLPLLYDDDGDDLSDEQNALLEKGLLDACRRVGILFFENGKPREGWMFLQPVGDRDLAQRLVEQIELDDNIDDVVEIALGEGAAPTFGYQLLLAHYGTCNAITTFDSQIAGAKRPVRKEIAELLVDHLYREITENVENHIAEHEGTKPVADSLVGLIAERPWLFAGGSHHVDTTHLASVMRIGRIVESVKQIGHLIELAEYGLRLDEQFHFNSDPPFENIYEDHAIFYKALKGTNVEEAVAHFRQKSESVDREQYGMLAVETLIDFLCRVDRFEEAIKLSAELLDEQRLGIAPTMMEIAAMQGSYQQASDLYRKKNDLLAWSIAEMQQKLIEASSDS